MNDQKKSKYPVPDVNQMLPFKPIRNASMLIKNKNEYKIKINFNTGFICLIKLIVPGMMHSIAGGIFPFPPAVTELVKRLPPPTAFDVN